MLRVERLDPHVFNLPVEKMRAGYYSDTYFNRAREILERDGHHPMVRMQVFQRNTSILCGIDEAIAIVRLCSGHAQAGEWRDGWADLAVRALHDGDEIAPYETVMTIEGDYALFAHLETCYLGVLSRRTRVATNAREIVDAANGKDVLYFPARYDHHMMQTGDGYAAYISGALGVSTDANAEWWGARGMGTVPHALIAAYDGDTVLATQKFAEYIPASVHVIALVDFDNDCVKTSVDVARALRKRLWGVRLDTSGTMVDRSLWDEMGTFVPTGVVPQLVRNVRSLARPRGLRPREDRRERWFQRRENSPRSKTTTCRSMRTRSAAHSSRAPAASISPPTSSRCSTTEAGLKRTKPAGPNGRIRA